MALRSTRYSATNGSYYGPRFLPNGQAVLFYIWNGSPDESQVAVYDIEANEQRVLLSGTSPHFATSGHLVFFREGSLWAVPFNPEHLEVRGEPRPVVEQVGVNVLGWARYSVAQDGTLAYRRSLDAGRVQHTLVWVDREGREEALGANPRPYRALQLSPDGRRVVTEVADSDNRDLWIYDIDRDTPIHFTLDPASDTDPIWTPDGERVVFSSSRDGFLSLFWKSVDGTEDAQRLRASTGPQYATAFAPDGRSLLFTELQRPSVDVGVFSIDGERTVEWLLESDYNESNAVVSPDGRWLASQSDETGQVEVYVRPFPNVSEGRWQVSTGGSRTPIWAPNGRELFYMGLQQDNGNIAVMVATVEPQPSFTSGSPATIIDGPYLGSNAHSYDISPDGQRFLMIKRTETNDEGLAPGEVIVVQNWHEELKRLVPVD